MSISSRPISALPVSAAPSQYVAPTGTTSDGYRVLRIPPEWRARVWLGEDELASTAAPTIVDDEAWFAQRRAPESTVVRVLLGDDELPIAVQNVLEEDYALTPRAAAAPWVVRQALEQDELPRVTFDEDYFVEPRLIRSQSYPAPFRDTDELPLATFDEDGWFPAAQWPVRWLSRTWADDELGTEAVNVLDDDPWFPGVWRASQAVKAPVAEADELPIATFDEDGWLPAVRWAGWNKATIWTDDDLGYSPLDDDAWNPPVWRDAATTRAPISAEDELAEVAASIVDEDQFIDLARWRGQSSIVLMQTGAPETSAEPAVPLEDDDWAPAKPWAQPGVTWVCGAQDELGFDQAALDEDGWLPGRPAQSVPRTWIALHTDEIGTVSVQTSARSILDLIREGLQLTSDGTGTTIPTVDHSGGVSGGWFVPRVRSGKKPTTDDVPRETVEQIKRVAKRDFAELRALNDEERAKKIKEALDKEFRTQQERLYLLVYLEVLNLEIIRLQIEEEEAMFMLLMIAASQ